MRMTGKGILDRTDECTDSTRLQPYEGGILEGRLGIIGRSVWRRGHNGWLSICALCLHTSNFPYHCVRVDCS
jgi:hypothetical protein